MSTQQELATTIFAMVEALRTATYDPADQIRLLVGLAGYQPLAAAVQPRAPAAVARQQAAAATAALCRRAALVSLARASADYAPASSTEAAATLRLIKAAFDAEIVIAGDTGDDASCRELRTLRSAVTRDLQRRGLLLPEIVTITRAVSEPSLVASYRLYQTAGRGDEMTNRARAAHPLFLPTVYEALSP